MNGVLQPGLVYLIVCLVSYLLGSVPVGLIVAKRKGVDIQRVGSGNIGGTNVGRKLGFKYGALVAGIDACKGALPVILLSHFFWHSGPLVGLAWLFVILGNVFPVWLKFRGGKGMAVFFGGLLALLNWQVYLIILGCWIAIFLFFTRRRASAANLILVGVIIVCILFLPALIYLGPTILIIVFVLLWTHRSNFERLAEGKEPPLNLPETLAFLNKLPDDILSLAIEKIQSFVKTLQKHQKKP